MVEKWNHYDTVLVDYQDYINFLRDELGYVIEEGNQISTLRSIGRKGRNMERDIELIGIKRSVDDLGRVVLPREIRQKLRIREGTSLEIFATTDGVFLKKCYSDSDLSDMVQNLDEAVDVACVDLGVETTGNIREHIREIQRLLKPQK
jgi:AbrB family looped-hinge helix DNA binding protein